jgi:peptidoglycan/LPS O-acetylase OafA/YrhL
VSTVEETPASANLVHNIAPAPGPVASTPAAQHWQHLPTLDGVRGLAILLILVHHAYSNLIPAGSTSSGSVPGAFIGVDVFFALSGFLITSLLLRERKRRGRIRLANFYARRALRLLPALYVMLAIYIVYASATNLPTTTVGIVPIATYWQNWADIANISTPTYLTHLWSLSVEEQFYLFWPIVLILLISFARRTRYIAGILVVALLAMNVYRIAAWQGQSSVLTFYARTHTRGDALIVGALAALLWSTRRFPRRGLVPAAYIATLFLAYCVARVGPAARFYYAGGFTLVGLAVAVIIVASLESNWAGNRVLRMRALATLGLVAYGLYLWHYLIFLSVQHYGASWTIAGRLAVAFSVTALFTAASWMLVEKPCLRWKDRLGR